MKTPALIAELQVAVRTLARRPSFALLATLTLGLGLGIATAMYSIVDGVLLRPLAYPAPEQLVAVYQTFPEWRQREGLSLRWDRMGISAPQFHEWQERQQSFQSVGAFARSSMVLTVQGGAEQVEVMRVSSSLLGVLGIGMTQGRFFAVGEDATPGTRVAVVSQEWSRDHLAGKDVVGSRVSLDGVSHEIVGVLPEGLDPTESGTPPAIWVPMGGVPSDAQPQTTNYSLIARLRPGSTPSSVATATGRQFASSSGASPRGARVALWQEELTANVRSPLLILLGASGLLLLLSCINVATLSVGEVTARTREFATRAALGAGNSRIARQLLAESAVVAGLGSGLGVVIAVCATRVLATLLPTRIPRLAAAQVDARVLLVVVGVGAMTTILIGLAPLVLGAIGRDLRQNRKRRSVPQALAAMQLALSLVLLVAAGLLGRSLYKVTRVEPGFPEAGLLVVELSPPGGTTARPDAVEALYQQMATSVRSIPGVASVAIGSSIPFTGGGGSNRVEFEVTPGTLVDVDARRSHVTPEFRATLGLRLLSGRDPDLSDQAGAPLVALINETTANRYWGGASAIGKRLRISDEWYTIAGIVSDVHHTALSDIPRAGVYLPLAQQPTRFLTLLVRLRCSVSGDRCPEASVTSAIRASVAAARPDVPVRRLDGMPKLVADSLAAERFRTALLGLFALVAAILAVVGTYGVAIRTIRGQRREIAIRSAIGSSPARITRLFVARATGMVAAGSLVGILGAVAASRLLAPFLYGVSGSDPLTYLACAALLGLTALLANWIPARRAAAASPVEVLRSS